MTERLDQQNLTPEDDLLSGSEIMSIHFQSQLLESLDGDSLTPEDDEGGDGNLDCADE